MAQLLHRQDSASYGKEFQGCRWGILQFFGFRRRLRPAKMISDKKHDQRSRGRAFYLSWKDEASGDMDDNNKNTEVADKHKGSKNSIKTSLKSFITRKLYGKKDQKEKILPVAPKLLRTLSIHYLERNEYVLDGESASIADGSLHSTTLSMQNVTGARLSFSTVDGCDIDTSSSKSAKRKSHRSISMDDSSLKPITNDVDDSVDTDVLNACTSAESLIQENIQENNFDGLQVDPMYEDELNYVKDIFSKSSFLNGNLFDEWCSTNTRALQEEDCQHYEAAAAALDLTDMSAEQLLLFDLTNEALLDIYKKYSVSKSMISRFDRPKPVGRQALKILCSEVSCHLDEQPRSSVEMDAILSNDLARSNHWVNFQRDSDQLRNKLADVVLDRLLAELTLELAKF